MRFRIVVAGASMGGLKAIVAVLSSLPADFAVPIAIVQHRSRHGDRLEKFLSERSPIPLHGVEDKDEFDRGRVYLAPADYHLLVEKEGFALSTDAPVMNSRPSIDVLFESAAEAFGRAVIGVVLTGANKDGACGGRRIKERGGLLICEDPATAESPTMPADAIRAAEPDHVLRLEEIGPLLVRLVCEQ